MKKMIWLLPMLFIVTLTWGQVKTIYLNSQTITCNVRGIKKDCLQYKNNQKDSVWSIYTGNIQGFTYNPGYFFTLQVRPVAKAIQPAWKLVKVVSKTRSTVQQQEGDTGIMMAGKPPVELAGRWIIVRLVNENYEIRFTPENEFLQFGNTEMKVTGKASCNTFFGNYTADSLHSIHFEALGHTMMACPNLETENKLLKALELVDNWKVENNNLYLRMGNRTLLELTKVTVGTI